MNLMQRQVDINLSRTMDVFLEIKFNNRNHVDDKIAWGLGGEALYFHLNFVC